MLCYVHSCGKEQNCVTAVEKELILCSKNPSWKANNFSAIQEIPHILQNQLVFLVYCTFFRLLYIFITSISNTPKTPHSEVCVSFIGPN